MSTTDVIDFDAIAEFVAEKVAERIERGDVWLSVSILDEMVGKRERKRAQAAGELRTVKRGRRVFVRRSWLDAYLEAGEQRNVEDRAHSDDDHVAALMRANGWKESVSE